MDITSLIEDENINLIRKASKLSGIEVFLVGGALRSLMLGAGCSDYDFIVFGDLPRFTGSAAKLLHRPVIRIGSGSKALHRIVKNGDIYDFTESKGATIKDDVMQRDFTINALAYSLNESVLFDFYSAKENLVSKDFVSKDFVSKDIISKDINNGIIRMVSDDAFDDDPLRMLRAFRFMAELGFTIEAKTLSHIVQKKGLINKAAAERIREEFFKILAVSSSYETIRRMADSGLLYTIFPELKDSVGCLSNEGHDAQSNKYHHLDVMEHTLLAYKTLEDIISRLHDFFPKMHKELSKFIFRNNADILLKYSILMHDVAKPGTKSEGDDGRIHFYQHCKVGEEIVGRINARLKLSGKDDAFIRSVVRWHLRIIDFLTAMDKGAVSKKSIIRYFMRLGDTGVYVIVHNLADLMATRGIKRAEKSEAAKIMKLCDMMLDVYFNEFIVRKKRPPLLTGKYLIEKFDLTPSPLFSEILNYVYEKQIAGEINTADEAAELIKTKFDLY